MNDNVNNSGTILLIFLIMSMISSVIGAGIFILYGPKVGDECESDDTNALYIINENGKCKFSNCNTDYEFDGTECVPKYYEDTFLGLNAGGTTGDDDDSGGGGTTGDDDDSGGGGTTGDDDDDDSGGGTDENSLTRYETQLSEAGWVGDSSPLTTGAYAGTTGTLTELQPRFRCSTVCPSNCKIGGKGVDIIKMARKTEVGKKELNETLSDNVQTGIAYCIGDEEWFKEKGGIGTTSKDFFAPDWQGPCCK
jgi:hypothetical protein